MSATIQKKYFLNQPRGFSALFFTQLFSTISFAVLYATLVLYMKAQLHMPSTQADLITGVYFACNFSLHLLAGYLGGRLFSYRGLVVFGILFQLIGCLILVHATLASLYWGLACMLIGTGTMVTCLNMLVSQLYAPTDVEKRQSGFLWNYSGMNFGFIFGFTLAGYFQIHVNYPMLFAITAVNNVIALFVLFTQWKQMGDLETRFSETSPLEQKKRMALGILILFILVPVLTLLLGHARFSDYLVLAIGGIMAILLIGIAIRCDHEARRRMFAFLILLFSAQIFWIIYQLAPMGLTLFAKNNVNRDVFGFLIAPGWIQNINSVTIIIGAPILGALFIWIRRATHHATLLPLQYAFGLLLAAVGLLILPIGISLGQAGYTAFIWLFATYVLQAIAELLISPIGYSMVGQLVAPRWQSICMGSILLNSGVAAVLASYLSNDALGKTGSSNPLVTNPTFSAMFSHLGWVTFGVAILMFLLAPLIKWLMR